MQFTASAPQYAFGPAMAPVPMMASGGLAAAAQTQAKGRGEDTMLVHMTPGEVKGLQALAMAQGGSLTINPSTGLPEAGILSSILPMLAGFALGPAGFALMSAPMAAVTVGGLTGLATGSLKKGLMAGLGAYGGANLGAGLQEAAAGTAENLAAPLQSVPSTVPNPPFQPGAAPVIGPTMPQPLGSFGSLGQANLGMVPTTGPFPTAGLGGIEAGGMGNVLQTSGGALAYKPVPTGLDAVTGGVKAMTAEGAAGEAARKAFIDKVGYSGLASAAAPIASAMAEPPTTYQGPVAYIRGYKFEWNPNKNAYDPSPTPGDSSERTYFTPTFTPEPVVRAATGGLTALAAGGTYDDEAGGDDQYAKGGKLKTRSLTGDDFYTFSQDRRDQSLKASLEQNFAKGGLPPRYLRGGGDGMSDSIKANIDGKQEARLADGEFVVPADVVSHLGNGSSNAGARKLYAMMDKIRKARTGRERQAPEVNAQKYMPA